MALAPLGMTTRGRPGYTPLLRVLVSKLLSWGRGEGPHVLGAVG